MQTNPIDESFIVNEILAHLQTFSRLLPELSSSTNNYPFIIHILKN